MMRALLIFFFSFIFVYSIVLYINNTANKAYFSITLCVSVHFCDAEFCVCGVGGTVNIACIQSGIVKRQVSCPQLLITAWLLHQSTYHQRFFLLLVCSSVFFCLLWRSLESKVALENHLLPRYGARRLLRSLPWIAPFKENRE